MKPVCSCRQAEQVYTYEEAAAKLGMKRRKLEGLRAAKKIGYYRIGGSVRFGESHIAEFQASVEVPATKLRRAA